MPAMHLLEHVDKCLKSEQSSVLCDLRRSADQDQGTAQVATGRFVAQYGASLTWHRSP